VTAGARRRRVVALAAVALLSGCGGPSDGGSPDGSGAGADDGFAGLPAAEKVATAKAAMEDLRALHIEGTISNGGDAADVDLSMDADGRCSGTFTIGEGVAEIRAVDGAAWFRPDDGIWAQFAGASADQVSDFVDGRWVVLEDAQFMEMCDFDSIMDSLLSSPEAGREYSDAGTETIDGERAFRIESAGPAGTSLGYVQAAAPHYLLRTQRDGGEAPATMTFSAFDDDVDVEAPAADEVVDLGDLAS
jgi:hypothetical protein